MISRLDNSFLQRCVDRFTEVLNFYQLNLLIVFHLIIKATCPLELSLLSLHHFNIRGM